MDSSDGLPVYHCRLLSTPIKVDGDISNPVWQSVPSIELKLANGKGLPVQSTSVRAAGIEPIDISPLRVRKVTSAPH